MQLRASTQFFGFTMATLLALYGNAPGQEHATAHLNVADYVLWRCETDENALASSEFPTPCTLQWGLRQYDLGNPTGSRPIPVQISRRRTIGTMVAWRLGGIEFSRILSLSENRTLSSLAPQKDLFDENEYGIAFLDASDDGRYVMTSLAAAFSRHITCPAGYTKYCLRDTETGKALLSKAFCYHSGHAEFSGFVNGTKSLGYFLSCEMEPFSHRWTTTDVLAIGKNGRLKKVASLFARAVLASPQRTSVLVYSFTFAKEDVEQENPTVMLELRSADWRQVYWSKTLDEADVRSGADDGEILWSRDGAIVVLSYDCISPGKGFATKMLCFDAKTGASVGQIRLPPAMQLWTSAMAIVPKSAGFDPYAIFGIEPREVTTRPAGG
jgi:hypothetical protein